MGRRTGSSAVLALAADHRNDIFSAAAAAVGIFFGRQGYVWVDPLVGALVALIVLRTGIEILRESSADLMDAVPGNDLSTEICQALDDIKGLEVVEEIRSHRFGPYLVIALTIGVDGSLTVSEGDEISSAVERRVLDRLDSARRVHVHYHPTSRKPDGSAAERACA